MSQLIKNFGRVTPDRLHDVRDNARCPGDLEGLRDSRRDRSRAVRRQVRPLAGRADR